MQLKSAERALPSAAVGAGRATSASAEEGALFLAALSCWGSCSLKCISSSQNRPLEKNLALVWKKVALINTLRV